MHSKEEELSSQPEGRERYQRNLGTLGIDGQRTLLSSRIVVVGLGGLGGHVLEQMGRAGAGHITGIDPDVFEAGNLNRQILSDIDSLGVSKVHRAKERIRQINPEIIFKGIEKRHLSAEEKIWSHADLVFDCLDNIEDRLSLARICSDIDCTLIHGAIAGWYGQVAVVRPGSGLLTRLYPEKGTGLEKELGTPPFTAALVASLMVSEGVKVLCRINAEERDRVRYVDLKDGSLWLVDM